MTHNGESCEAEFSISNRGGASRGDLGGGGGGLKLINAHHFGKIKELLGGKSL